MNNIINFLEEKKKIQIKQNSFLTLRKLQKNLLKVYLEEMKTTGKENPRLNCTFNALTALGEEIKQNFSKELKEEQDKQKISKII